MKGRFTIRAAGVLFALSAFVEALSIRVEIPLFGVLRGGLIGATYHATFAAIFLTIGFGLWTGARWGANIVYMGTAIYSLDRFRYVLDRPGRAAEITTQLGGYPEIVEAFGVDLLLQVGALLALLFVACWWGFAVYIYLRREYFAPGASTRGPRR